jgi:hypothetical protein
MKLPHPTGFGGFISHDHGACGGKTRLRHRFRPGEQLFFPLLSGYAISFVLPARNQK